MTQIKINFAPQFPLTLSRARLYVAIGVICCVLVMAYQMLTLDALHSRIEDIDRKVSSLSEKHKRLEKVSVTLPDYNVLKELERKSKLVNKLVHHIGDNTLSVLNVVEKELPGKVLLTEFVHQPELGEIDMTLKSQDTDELTAFVHHLEANKNFRQVLIRRQSHAKEDEGTTVYEIRVLQ